MKKDWVYKKLGEVANVIHGKKKFYPLMENIQYMVVEEPLWDMPQNTYVKQEQQF